MKGKNISELKKCSIKVYTHVSTVPDMYVPADFAKILAPL
jgi:hypothetical protein